MSKIGIVFAGLFLVLVGYVLFLGFDRFDTSAGLVGIDFVLLLLLAFPWTLFLGVIDSDYVLYAGYILNAGILYFIGWGISRLLLSVRTTANAGQIAPSGRNLLRTLVVLAAVIIAVFLYFFYFSSFFGISFNP